MIVDLAAVFLRFRASLFVAGLVALVDGLQTPPHGAEGRPADRVAQGRGQRLVAAQVLAGIGPVAVAAGEIQLAAFLPEVFFAGLVGLARARIVEVHRRADFLALRQRVQVGGQIGQRHACLIVLVQVLELLGHGGIVRLHAVEQVHLRGADFLFGLVPFRVVLGDLDAAVREAAGEGLAVGERFLPHLFALAETQFIGRELVDRRPLGLVDLHARQGIEAVRVVFVLQGRELGPEEGAEIGQIRLRIGVHGRGPDTQHPKRSQQQ